MGNAVTVPSPFAIDLTISATNIAFGKTSYREKCRESTTSVNSAILLLNLTACHVYALHSNDISEREKNAKDHMMLDSRFRRGGQRTSTRAISKSGEQFVSPAVNARDQAAFPPCCRRDSPLKTFDSDASSHNLGGRRINRGC